MVSDATAQSLDLCAVSNPSRRLSFLPWNEARLRAFRLRKGIIPRAMAGGPIQMEGRNVMSQRTFALVAGLVFSVVAAAHLARLILGWSVILNGWIIPMWVSVIALVVSGSLAFQGLRPHSR
jgi:hypothetical protein